MKKVKVPVYLDRLIHAYNDSGRFSAARICVAVKNSLREFCGDDLDLYVDDLTPNLMSSYENFLIIEKKCSWNTSSLYLRFIRVLYNRVLEEGRVAYIPNLFKHVFTGVLSNHQRALKPQELRALLAENSSSEQVDSDAEMFNMPDRLTAKAAVCLELLFRLQGISFRDLAMLRKADVHDDYLVIRRKKTGVEMHIRITAQVRKLFQQCEGDADSPFLLNLLDGKLTGKALYQNYCHALSRMNYYLKKLAVLRGVCRNVTSYCARHSWATIAKNADVPLLIISECMGHSSVTTTQTYLKASDNERLDAANALVVKRVFG
jgi:integrase